jgi:catechol 2,3-dioxygenase-like lactoylglutathione lyase family enzyme
MRNKNFTTRLAHVCIETADLARTEAFYAVLGLSRRYEFRNIEIRQYTDESMQARGGVCRVDYTPWTRAQAQCDAADGPRSRTARA